jgi:hypothetical protein
MDRFLRKFRSGRVFRQDEPPGEPPPLELVEGEPEGDPEPEPEPEGEPEPEYVSREDFQQANSTWEGRVRAEQSAKDSQRQKFLGQLAKGGLTLDENDEIVPISQSAPVLPAAPVTPNAAAQPAPDDLLAAFEENTGIEASLVAPLINAVVSQRLEEALKPYAQVLERVVETTGSIAEQQALAGLQGVDEPLKADIRSQLQQHGIHPAMATAEQVKQCYYMALGKRAAAGLGNPAPTPAPGPTRDEIIAAAGTAGGGTPPANTGAGDATLMAQWNTNPQDLAARGMTIQDLRDIKLGGLD